MTKLIVACLGAVSVAASSRVPEDYVYKYKGWAWENWAAEFKHGRMWDEVLEDTRTKEIDFNIAQVFDLTANDTTCSERDERNPNQGEKLLHQTGVVAPFRWESLDDHDYTGLFGTGTDFGLMRLSDSGIIVNESSNPSVALKMFVDGQVSVNLVFSLGFPNTDGWHFFPSDESDEHLPFTTHPPVPNADDHTCDWETKVRKVRDATHMPFAVGTSHVASVNWDGSEELEPWFPFELQLHVNPYAISEYTEGDDPLDYLTEMPLVEDEPLFTVMARDMPDSDLEAIAEIYLSDGFTRSFFGDTRMFFRHQNFNRDLAIFRDSEDQDLVDRGDAWANGENARMGGGSWKLGLNPWEDGNYETPDMLSNPEWGATYQEVYENSVNGLINEHECPFAWMFEVMEHLQ